MLDKVNLNLFRSLQVLLTECHVSRAANQLHITQSAMSRQLAQLRILFSDPLLVREGNALYLTPKAQDLKTKMDNLFLEFEHLLDEERFEPSKWEGKFTFASSDYVAQYIFPVVVENISNHAPRASFEYKMWQPDMLSELGSRLYLASAMLTERPIGVSSRLLGEDRPVVVMKSTHPLAVQKSLRIEEILSYPHIAVTGGSDKDIHFDRELASIGLVRTVGLRVPFFTSALSTVVKSNYLLVIPEHIARNLSSTSDIVYFDIPVDLPVQKYWLLWHPKYNHDLAHEWLRELTFEILQESEYSIGHDFKS